MFRKHLKELTGGEILARDIRDEDYRVILSQGTVIRKEYLKKLDELGICEVYVKSAESDTKDAAFRTEMEESIQKSVKEILERHTYHNNQELAELGEAADSIITLILEEKRLLDRVYDIRQRNTDMYTHSICVCSFAILIGLKLDIQRERIHDMGVGCLLHDIGFRYMPVDYYNRDVGTLNRQAQAEYRKHPVTGYSSLKDEDWISDLSKEVILYHHERLDGSGFPLHKKNVPLECRIVSVCDAFDEMICGIACKQVKVYEAVEYLKGCKNTLFDGKIVDMFLSFTAVYPAGTLVVTNEGELAVVLSQNQDFPDRPVIRILKDKDGRDRTDGVIMDLVKVHHVFIEKIKD